MRFIKLATLLVAASLFSVTYACDENDGPALSKIQVQLSAEQWVTTKSAKVYVNVTAALKSAGLSELQQKVKDDLNSIASADWRITVFSRSQDASGLERANLQAEARLSEEQLQGLRDKAKSLSKPGEKFQISGIGYSPSFKEINAANSELRKKLYNEAKSELAKINSLYAPRHYEIYDINLGGYGPITPSRFAGNKAVMMRANVMGDSAESSMSVTQKLQSQATVTFAAPLFGGKGAQ